MNHNVLWKLILELKLEIIIEIESKEILIICKIDCMFLPPFLDALYLRRKFIVIASDSIWQYIDSNECVIIIKGYFYEINMGAVGALIKELKKHENKKEDITVVVFFWILQHNNSK